MQVLPAGRAGVPAREKGRATILRGFFSSHPSNIYAFRTDTIRISGELLLRIEEHDGT
jgi:hypothetical protein